jgi:hypothetical protein
MTGAIGVAGREEILVSKRGLASGSERRVIQKANGEESKLKTKSEEFTKDVSGGAGRAMMSCGMVYCLLAVSKILT